MLPTITPVILAIKSPIDDFRYKRGSCKISDNGTKIAIKSQYFLFKPRVRPHKKLQIEYARICAIVLTSSPYEVFEMGVTDPNMMIPSEMNAKY